MAASTLAGFWGVAAESRYTSGRPPMRRARIGKSARISSGGGAPGEGVTAVGWTALVVIGVLLSRSPGVGVGLDVGGRRGQLLGDPLADLALEVRVVELHDQ